MRMGVLEHLGIARRRHGCSPRNPEKVLLCVLPILAVRPIFIEDLEKTFALCSQFNPPR
jgi:hypothetical protein